MPHLTPEQLMLYRSGQSRDREVQAHLETCETCRRRAAGAHPATALLHADAKPIPERHPSEAALADYIDGNLPDAQRERVARHLRRCSRCMAYLDMVREAADQPAAPAPADLVARARERIRGRPEAHLLGLATAEPWGETTLRFMLAPGSAGAPDAVSAPLPAQSVPLPMQSAPAPAPPPPQNMAPGAAAARFEFTFTGPLAKSLAVTETTDLPLDLEAGTMRLTLRVLRGKHQATLLFTARDRETLQPRVGLELTLLPASGMPASTLTDRAGEARLRLFFGESRLRIRGREVWELTLRIPAKTDVNP